MLKYRWKAGKFLFYDYNGLAAWLEQMAARGLMVETHGIFGWKFRKTEPLSVKFYVTYFSEASDFNPYPPENQKRFLEYCEEAGWKLAAEQAQMQVLYSHEESPIPVETDEFLKWRAIHQAMKKNFLLSGAIVLGIGVLQLLMQIYTLFHSPIRLLSDSTSLFSTALWFLVTLYTVSILCGYGSWYCRSKAAVLQGGTCAENGRVHVIFEDAMTALFIGLIFLLLIDTAFRGYGPLMAAVAGIFLAEGGIVALMKKFLKGRGASRSFNRTVSILSGVLFAIGFMAVLTWAMVSDKVDLSPSSYQSSPKAEGYFPLTAQDIPGISTNFADSYQYQWADKSSPFLQYRSYWQNMPASVGISDAPELDYEIVDVKFQPFYRLCLRDILSLPSYPKNVPDEFKDYWSRTDGAVWEADAVYELSSNGESFGNRFVLCWGQRIIKISFSWTPTEEEISAAVRKLKPE